MIGSWCAADAVESQPLPGHVLQQEYELVKNAFYTEPHDQSSWLYLRWLIGNSLAGWEIAKGTPQEASATQVAFCVACSLWCEFMCGNLLLGLPSIFPSMYCKSWGPDTPYTSSVELIDAKVGMCRSLASDGH